MGDQQGTFIVIEGADGSGKTTQLELLRSRLTANGYDTVVFDFPRYNEPSSYFVRQYLSGGYGDVDDVGPYTASLFYALDRYAAAGKIRAALAQGKIVLADRYVGSNMAHQGTKFRNVEERRGYFIWLDNLEFEMLGIPRPNMSFVLHAPFELSQQLLDKRVSKTAIPRDIHEADLNHLKKALTVFEDMCQLFPKDFVRVDTARSGTLLEPEAVEAIMWQKVVPLLPEKKKTAAVTTKSETINASPYLEQNDRGIYEVTPAGKHFLEGVVTNSESNVYSFTDKLSPMLIASALSQRTKRADDLRLLLLEDYAGAQDEQRIIKQNSDKTSKRLTGMYAIVENASNLLTKKLERHNIASYLELSSPYTYLDQRDADGRYAYYTPPELDSATTKHYQAHMDGLFEAYSGLVHRLTTYLEENSAVPATRRNNAWHTRVRAEACQAASAVLPIATTTAVGVFASEEALERLVRELLSDELPEARTVGEQLLSELRKAIPNFLHGADLDSLQSTIKYQVSVREAVNEIANTYLHQTHGGGEQTAGVQLIEVAPRNELDLIPDMLYVASNLPYRDLRTETAKWPYDQKLRAFLGYLGNRESRQQLPGRALEKARYTWELMTDYASFRHLQQNLSADPEWQPLTPRYGFAMPKLVTAAHLEDEFEACFDLSLQLYSLLQDKGYAAEAQYATLLGHKLRFKLTHTALEAFGLHEYSETVANPAYREVVNTMYEKLSEAHPIIGEAVKFADRPSEIRQ